MSSYIGKVQVESGDPILIGSTLYGICPSTVAASTAAKTVTLNGFDTLMNGITVHVRFVNGNTATSNVTLAVGSTSAKAVVGNCVCNENDVIAFTFHQESVNNVVTETWYVNSNIVAAEGSSNGQIVINGQGVNVHGLGSAAYTDASTYAPVNNPAFTGTVTLPAAPTSDLEAATKKYVDDATSNLSGLSGAMHFKGITSTAITNGGTENPTIGGTALTTKEAGDVVLYNQQEFVWNGTAWQLLGDEGSYVLATSQTSGSVGSASGWSAGSASTAVVSGGILQLTNSVVPSLTVTSTNVIVPVTT